MDISREMYIWVDSVFQRREEGGSVFDGYSFDDELGFGLEKREYEGEFLQISKDRKMKTGGKISMIHYSRSGLKWVAYNVSFLNLPLLITSNLSVNHIYSGEIQLIPSHETEMALKKYPNNNFAVISESCIGNLIFYEKSIWIDVFSDKEFIRNTDFLTERFCFAGYDKCIGQMEL